MQAQAVRYPPAGDFHTELRRRVAARFEAVGLSTRDDPAMYRKTAVLLLWHFASWAALVFLAQTWWQALLLAISCGAAAAGIGMDVMHDANHGGYSRHTGLNRALAYTLDLLGGSSYIWTWKHNVLHHTYPNLAGLDADIAMAPLARMAPQQRRNGAHRFQHLYMWGLYGFLAIKWHFIDDYQNLITGRIGSQRYPRPRGWDLVGLLGGKAFFYLYVLVLPLLLHKVSAVLLCYFAASFTLSVILAVTFQMAHCVSQAEFPEQPRAGEHMPMGWAEHQLHTTVDFAPRSRVLTWYLGGLNFQIEHHLFPKVCHVHYPALAPIVEGTCRDFGVPYRVNRTLGDALASHLRWLRQMGAPPALTS